MSNQFSHLNAIDLRLSHERTRRDLATNAKEREWREHNIKMIEREREGEIQFLRSKGIEVVEETDELLSLDEIFAELEGL